MARQRHFEHHRQPLLSPQAFAVRVLTYLGYASIILVIAGWAWLRRRDAARPQAAMPVPMPAE